MRQGRRTRRSGRGGVGRSAAAPWLPLVCCSFFAVASASGCFGADLDIEQLPPGEEEPGQQAPTRRSPEPAALERCGAGAPWGLLPPRDLQIRRVSAFQAVEVPLVVFGEVVERPRVDLVQGRDLLVRVFVSPRRGTRVERRERRAHMILERTDAEPLVYEDVRPIVEASRSEELGSTFNFYVPGQDLLGARALAVELWDQDVCGGVERRPVRVPQTGAFPLRARATGPARVHIVPIRFDGDGSGRLPNVSPEHLETLSSSLAALFPVSHVELTVREPVGTSESSLTDILNQLMQLRSVERPPENVSYYGLVNPAATMQEHCRFGCVAGVATFGAAGGTGAVGVGLGYRAAAEGTFVHEMGHVYRLMHAPCGAAVGTDPGFPYVDATLGSWGYDARTGTLVDPHDSYRDFMSYCDPAWISDYNYQSLVDRLSIVNGLQPRDSAPVRRASAASLERAWGPFEARISATAVATPFGGVVWSSPGSSWRGGDGSGARRAEESLEVEVPGQVFRTLRRDGAGQLSWGLPIEAVEAPGEVTLAEVLDEAGAVITELEVGRLELSDEAGALYFMPPPQPGWSGVRVEGYGPHPFAEATRVRPFTP